MRRVSHRLRIGLVVLAWLAQLCLPLAHAVAMSSAATQPSGWCGDAAQASAFLAELPADLRQAYEPDHASAEQLAACTQLCAVATTPTLPTAAPPIPLAQATRHAMVPALHTSVFVREPISRPPVRGPPKRA